MKFCVEASARMIAIASVACCAIAAPAAGADIFRCKDNGKIVYSDRPCVGEVAALNLFVVAARATPSPAEPADSNVPNAALGMTPEEVVAGEGPPFEKSAELNARAAEIRWTYCRDGVLSDVWFQRGAVTRIARRASSLPAAASMVRESALRPAIGGQDASATPAVDSRNIPVNASGGRTAARYPSH